MLEGWAQARLQHFYLTTVIQLRALMITLQKNVDSLADVPPRALGRRPDPRAALNGTNVLLGLSSPQTDIPRRTEEAASAPERHRIANAKQHARTSFCT